MENTNYPGQRIYDLAKKLFPICRSITGAGVRETLQILSDYIGTEDGIDLNIHHVPSGTQVFDWTVPKEWIIRDAYIEDETNNKIIDFKAHNLHVMGYSTPVDQWVDLEELKTYIYTQPEQPEVIPYVTSYYKERFGFCMSENQKKSLKPGMYHMYIDSELIDGHLTYGEIILPCTSEKEIFFSTYICHPSMANNECSGPALAAELIRYVSSLKNRRYTYRFIFIPETIGSITYLSRNLDHMKKHTIAGFNLSCVGDNRAYSIVESRYANTLSDRVLTNVLVHRGEYKTYSFLQRGSDERQYNAPGVDLPVVGFSRTKYWEYPEYHTSADDMSVVSPDGFQGAYEVMTQVVTTLEHNGYYRIKVLCEPQLGKRGLYPTISQKGTYNEVKAMIDFIAYADGKNDLVDISNRIHAPAVKLIEIAQKLVNNNLMDRTDDPIES